MARKARHNFLNWQLGFTWECPVDAEVVREDKLLSKLLARDRPFREWVTLSDGKVVTATFGSGTVALRFSRHSDRREVREWLRNAPEPVLCRLELAAAEAGRMSGRLAMMRTALPAVLEHAPCVLLEEGILTDVSVKALVQEAGIPLGDQNCVLVVQTPVRLRTEEQAPTDEVKLYLHGGGMLTCQIMGTGEEQYLHAREFEQTPNRDLANVRFVASPKPCFVTSVGEIRASPLDVLTPVTNDHLRAWMDYEHAARRRKEAILEVRQAHPLEYSEIVSGPTSGRGQNNLYQVALVTAEDALEHWVEEGQRPRDGVWKLDASASLYDLGGRPGELNVSLAQIRKQRDGRIVGVLELDSSVTPPAAGKLCAKPHDGDKSQHGRRDNAIERLRSGRAANPDLLRYLLFPETIPRIQSQDRAHRTRPGGATLNEQQRRAVVRAAREPAMLLIQGPPGTGKTTVIAEIIHALRGRRRSAAVDDEQGPLRVLVSSIQNDAVDNAAEKLSSQDVFVDLHVADSEDAVAHASATELRSRGVAEKLYAELSAVPGFRSYERLCQLSDLVRGLAPRLSVPDSSTVANIEGALGAPALQQELTEGLREELGRLLAALKLLLREREENEQALDPKPDPSVGKSADLQGAIDALVGETSSLTMENLDHRVMLIGNLQKLLDHPNQQFDLEVEALRSAILAVSRLERARTRGGVDERAEAAWLEVHRESSAALKAPQQLSQDGNDEFQRWEREAAEWLERVNAHLEERFEQHATSEAAVRFDWIRALNDRPMTMPEVIRSYAPVTAATCQRSDRFKHTTYDVVIIDEAGRGGLDVLIPMTMGRSVLLIGDQKQLPPHVEQELERELEEELRRQVDLSTASLFSFLWDALGGTTSANCVALDTQYRMHRDIGTLVSRSFYEPEVRLQHDCDGGRDAARAPNFGLFEGEPFVWVDTSDRLQKGDLGEWPFSEENPWDAELVISILSALDGEALAALAERGKTRRPIGLIPFYGAQRSRLEQDLQRKLPKLAKFVELGTADSFQGKEFPLVILSTVRSNADGRVGFLSLPNRLNVGISRAQSQVVMLADSKCLTHPERGSDPFRSVWRDVNDPNLPGRVVPSLKV